MLNKKFFKILFVIFISFLFLKTDFICNANNTNDNYYDISINKNPRRWEEIPITFYIPKDNEYYKSIKDAFYTWQIKTDEIISFKEAKNTDEADIVVQIDKNLPENKSTVTNISGLNNLLSANGKIYKATITLAYMDRDTNTKIPYNRMYQIALHEIGHSIGIVNHSNNPNDIMYVPLQKNVQTLSDSDINTIVLIYSDFEFNLKNQKEAFNKKIKDAHLMVKLNPNSSFYHLQLAKLYKENGDYKKAYLYCEKSLKLDSSNSKARFQKGIILYKQKKYEESYAEFYNLVSEYPENPIYLQGFVNVSYKVKKETVAKEFFKNFKNNYYNQTNAKFIKLIEKTIKFNESSAKRIKK